MFDGEWQHPRKVALFRVLFIVTVNRAIAVMVSFINPDQALGKDV